MVFAVGAPIILLVYSYYSFQFDRASAHLTIELTNPGSFERQARMSADPVQVTLFLISFNGLRIRSALSFILRVGMNLTFAYRLKRIVEVTVQKAAQRLSSQQSLAKPVEQKAVPKCVAVLFLILGCALLVYTHACVRTAESACARFAQCAAHVHRVSTDSERCPCLVMIDVDRAPKTYAEWENPPDATETLRALALSGDLRVLEVTNRRLLAFPEELHRCSRLHHMYVFASRAARSSQPSLVPSASHELRVTTAISSLTHTGIQEIPDWAKDLELLEFLYVLACTMLNLREH